MYIFLSILIVIASLILIGAVLIQKSKGGGLSSQFGGAGNVMGVRQTNSFLEKTTWTLAALIVVLSIASSFALRGESKAETRFNAPAAPAPAAATTTNTPVAAETEAPAAATPAAE